MTDVTTAPDTADKLIDAGTKLAERLSEIGQQYGPQVAELGLSAYRVDAISSLVSAGFGFLIGAGLAVSSYKFGKFLIGSIKEHGLWRRSDRKGAEPYDVSGPEFIPVVFGALLSICLLVISSLTLTDAWLWVGISHPELLMAKQVLGL